jgi:hypothetical protein
MSVVVSRPLRLTTSRNSAKQKPAKIRADAGEGAHDEAVASAGLSPWVNAPAPGRSSDGRGRRRFLFALPFLGVLVWALVSYAAWMVQPTSMSWSERSTEWVRTDVPFGNWMVDEGEHVHYSLNAPTKGGPQLKRLPNLGLTSAAVVAPRHAAARRRAYSPPRIKPIFAHPLPGEGVWRPTGPSVDGRPPVLVTTFRSELDYPRIVAYVAWFDHTRTAAAYYPGRYEPPSAAAIPC